MHFSQQRRRRVLSEEASAANLEQTARSTSGTSRSRGSAETYTSQARRDEQPRLTDLVPTRYRTLALLYLAGLLMLAAFEGLYLRIDALTPHLERQALGAFDLAGRSSFAAWYSSLLLTGTAVMAALLFSLRRHRIDDYRGRYRIWIWATPGWLALAVNQTADLDDLCHELVDKAAGWAGLAPGWTWPSVCGSLVLVCLVRLSFEVRSSRGAFVLLWVGTAEWTVAAAGMNLFAIESPVYRVMIAAGAKILGQLTLVAAHGAYARHVLFDAHGMLPARNTSSKPAGTRRSRKATVLAGDATEAARPARTDLDPPLIAAQQMGLASASPRSDSTTAAKPAPATPSASRPMGRQADDELDDDDDSGSTEGLSRAERKRLRRERKLDQRRAA